MKKLLIKRIKSEIREIKLDILLIEYQIKFYQSKGETEIQNGLNLIEHKKGELKWKSEILNFIKSADEQGETRNNHAETKDRQN